MKNHFSSKMLLALAAGIAAVGFELPVNAQSVPPSAGASSLPAGITAGTPAAEVLKLAQAGVDASLILSYISNCPSAFNLDAGQIVALTDAGVSSALVNAMMAHDRNLAAAAPQPAAPGPVPTPADEANISPPATDMTVDDFDNTLAPYGQWIQVDGYGRCWRPTVVVYDSTWQPYCDRGCWIYTDCGWYWDSNYAWGVTFHYGRWFNHPRYGWCWWPDTVWAPSWVTWRSSSGYCGWAPLPPFTVYQPGVGFAYRGVNVAVGFNFGLPASCFTFVSIGHFCDPQPRNYCVPRQQVTQIYNQTIVINNYHYSQRTIVNDGVPVVVVASAARRPIQPVNVSTLRNTSYHGWQGGNVNQDNRYKSGLPVSPATPNSGNPDVYRGSTPYYNEDEHTQHSYTDGGSGHRPPFTPKQPENHSGDVAPPGHPQNSGTPSGQPNQHQPGWSGRNFDNTPARNFAAAAPNRRLHTVSTAPLESSSAGGKFQGWMAQNR